MGLQEPRQAGDGASRDGSQSQLLEHSKLLGELKYCRHSNRKTKESGKHPDRDAQFEYINAKVEEFQAEDQPVISIDAKKKELLGEFKNGGSDYSPQGRPIEVNTHDFEDKELGKVVPYGVYDIGANDGYVSLGIDHDTGQFAVNSVRLWLDRIGRARYLGMSRLMITADGGGSNGSRLRLWKWSLQQLADETGLIIEVCHYFQVEQDRASHVLLHHPELARHASRQPLRRNRADRPHHDKKRAFDPLRPRS
jgi:hypothetical protein